MPVFFDFFKKISILLQFESFMFFKSVRSEVSIQKTDPFSGSSTFNIPTFGKLNSNGSVIPIFNEQIAKGGPVTITHPDMIRYFMSINDAVKLILEENFGQKLLILNMGPQIKIESIAKNMIEEKGAKVVDEGEKEKFSGGRAALIIRKCDVPGGNLQELRRKIFHTF